MVMILGGYMVTGLLGSVMKGWLQLLMDVHVWKWWMCRTVQTSPMQVCGHLHKVFETLCSLSWGLVLMWHRWDSATWLHPVSIWGSWMSNVAPTWVTLAFMQSLRVAQICVRYKFTAFYKQSYIFTFTCMHLSCIENIPWTFREVPHRRKDDYL